MAIFAPSMGTGVVGRVITPRRAAMAGIIGPAVFGLLILILTIVELDFLLSLGWQPLGVSNVAWPSGLALGPYGWLQVANFVQFGVVLIVFALGLRRVITIGRAARIGPALLIVSGFAMVCLGFKADPPYMTPTPEAQISWWIHGVAFFMHVGSLGPAVFVIGWQLHKHPRWRGYGWYTLCTGLLVVILVCVPGQVGVYLLLGTLLTWIEVIAIRLWKLAA